VTGLDLAHLLRVAERAACIGGEVVSASFGDPSNVREKAPGDWVSDVDTASEHAVRDALAEGAPGIAFFGEESGGERAALGWLVDPLDGTANFLHGFPAVGVSVGLVLDGRPVVGVVHAPLLGDTYCATEGGGATRNGTPLAVSTRAPSEAIPATGFPFRRKDRLPAYLEVFHQAFEAVEDLRRAGAASLDLAWTAAGVFDGFFELALGPWDVAAGALLVREAGGVVTDWTGDPDAWLGSGDIVAAPPGVHARLLEITSDATV
jgi:myo-inositol-1(or 4)-monophosphatase